LKSLGIYNRISRDNLLLLVFLLYILCPSADLIAQENFPIGSRPASLANAVVMESDIWSVSHNQAGLGDYHNFSIGFHHENKYVVPQAALHALALTIPVKPGTFGLSYTYFGYSLYNESKIGLGFGRSFGEKFSAGIQMNYHYIYVSPAYLSGEYENRHALTVEGGIQYKPSPKLRIGIHVFNPSRSHLSPMNTDTLITTLRAGISYSPVEKLWMAIETEKSLSYKLRIKSGIEYKLNKGLSLRTGIITSPFQNSFGLGFNISRINADVAFSHNEILGFMPHFSLQFRLK
jgi:hypothetical protein